MSNNLWPLHETLTSITNVYFGNYFEWRFIWIYTCCNFRIYPMWPESYHEKLSTTNWIGHLGSFDKSRLESEINDTLYKSLSMRITCSLKGLLEKKTRISKFWVRKSELDKFPFKLESLDRSWKVWIEVGKFSRQYWVTKKFLTSGRTFQLLFSSFISNFPT